MIIKLEYYSIQDMKRSAMPFEKYLELIHAEGYEGLDDEMTDSFYDWVSELEPEEIIKYANEYGTSLLKLI